MTEAFEPIRRIKEYVDSSTQDARWIATGIVSEIRTSDKKIRVKILPEMEETNWLKVYYFNAGDGYSTGPIPEKDSEVVLLFPQAHPDNAFILAGNFICDDDKQDPLKDDYEFPIYDKYGNKITLNKSGITINAFKDMNVTVNGNVNLKASNVTVDASKIELGKSATEKAILGTTFLTFFNNHAHPTAMGPTGLAIVPMTEALHLTTITKVK